MEWHPISKKPEHSMPVLYFMANAFWTDTDGNKTTDFAPDGREEKFHLGFYDSRFGGEMCWCENGTGHSLFEPGTDEDWHPTHWASIHPPHSA